MQIKFDFNNMMQEQLGDKGITEGQIEAVRAKAKDAYEYLEANRGKGWMGWTELPYNQEDIVRDIIFTAAEVRAHFDNFVVLGIGGSALGPMAAFNALCHLHYNELDPKKRGVKFYVEDNVDPERMLALLDVIDPAKTMFNVITKSGATSETMSQYLIITDILKKRIGKDWAKHIIATTSESKGNLIKLAKENGFKTYFIPDSVGGRFSELCPVGLLPAAVLGIDIISMLRGAAEVDKACNGSDPYKNPALMAAVLQYIAMEEKGANISVMMPYADSLKLMADWYCQLWGESLGKAVDFDGKVVHKGQTPVKSLGVTDQHSQVQLYTEGPFDKVITLIGVERFRGNVEIPVGAEEFPDVNFLCGHSMQELINTERKATEYALTRSKHLNRTILLDEVSASTIGGLMMFFQLETAYCGKMLNIDTFNQPGVEEGKNATYAMFNRKGYDAKKAELDSAPKKNPKYII